MPVDVHHGDSREVLDTLDADSLDSCVTDPPYALVSIGERFGAEDAAPPKGGVYARAVGGFMGKTWDTGEVAFDPEFWRKVYRVLKPGAYLLAFGATRTYHELGTAIQTAGFEVRDSILDVIAADAPVRTFLASLNEEQCRAFAKCVEESAFGGLFAWVYGSGFPKSTDFAAIPGSKKNGGREVRPEFIGTPYEEGWGTALKPAFEPIVVARKPLAEPTIARNVARFGTGGLNIGASRIGNETITTAAKAKGASFTSVGEGQGFNGCDASTHEGRWPSNVVTDGSDEVLAAFPSSPAPGGNVKGSEPSDPTKGVYAEGFTRAPYTRRGEASAARRYSEAGSTNFAALPGERVADGGGSAARFFYSAKADAEDRLGSEHPTVKRVDLMRHFVQLVTPPGGTVLDPFAGSGTTGVAAFGSGFNAVLIERDDGYVADIRRKLAWAAGEGRLTALEQARKFDPDKAAGLDTPLFGGGM